MNEELKKHIKGIISKTIDELVIEELKKMPEKIKKQQQYDKMTKAQKQDQIDLDLFYGGENRKEIDTKIQLKESDIIKISAMELESFKNDFISHLPGHAVDFDNQIVNGKKSIASFPYSHGTTDAVVTGRVDNKITFRMSLKDGFIINANEVKIDDDNKDLFIKLFNLYNTLFKQKFTEFLK